MSNTNDRKLSRRAMLRGSLRGGLLALMGGGAAWLALRESSGDPEAEACINRRLCRSCRILDRCELPWALSARQSEVTDG